MVLVCRGKIEKSIRSIAAICLLFLLANPHDCASRTLRIAFGDALPPWVIPESDSGILIDIVKEGLEPAGYRIQSVYVPYARRLIAYKRGDVDAVCDINQKVMINSGLKGYLSDMAYQYENIGVSLRKNDFGFSEIGDLLNVSIVSWQGAKAAIGGEYAEMAAHNPRYSEVADQKLQINLLYSGRADLIQLDRQIFRYFRKKVGDEGRINTDQPVDIFPLFGKNECGFLFAEKEIQAVFNRNFDRFKKDGGYDKLFRTYSH